MAAGLRLHDATGNVILDLTDRTATVAGFFNRTGPTGVEIITIPFPPNIGSSNIWAYASAINSGEFWQYQVWIDYPAANQFRFQVVSAPAGAVTAFYYGWL